MTPMIDIVFQLIAFFMVLINFTETVVDARVVLPRSELAKPPDQQIKPQLTIQMTVNGLAIVHGETFDPKNELPGILQREIRVLGREGSSPVATTIILRAHKEGATGKVQEIIEACQNKGFEKFRLRAEEVIK